MPGTSTLTPEQLDEFDRRGVLRLAGLLSAERVRRAHQHVLSGLAQHGLWKDGAWCLGAVSRPRWPATGLKTSKMIGNKHPDMEALVDEPVLLSAVEALLGGCTFDRAMSGGPQVLFTLPNSDTWTVPTTGWHVDIPRLASGRRPGVQLFAFLDTVEPRGGGTLVVAGSHRLLNDGRFIRSRDVRYQLGREAYFRDLYSAPLGVAARAGLLGCAGAVQDVALQVVELAGEPGDAYLTDLRLLHTGSPNTADRPRIMATHRFVRADVVRELTQGYGWDR